MLLGTALGVSIVLLIRGTALYQDTPVWTDPALLLGVRSVAGHVVMQVIYAARSALFLFYLLFLFRVLLRNQWAAGIVFVLLFSVIDALDSDTPLLEGATTFLYFGMLAAAVLRWGLVTLTTAMLVASLLLIVAGDLRIHRAWHFSASAALLLIPIALAVWAFYSSVGGRVFAGKSLGVGLRAKFVVVGNRRSEDRRLHEVYRCVMLTNRGSMSTGTSLSRSSTRCTSGRITTIVFNISVAAA